jgi:Zn-dependent M28 family amino/carboxypeptidase
MRIHECKRLIAAKIMRIRIRWITNLAVVLMCLFFASTAFVVLHAADSGAEEKFIMVDVAETAQRLKEHLNVLTVNIGERSVLIPENLKKTAGYLAEFYRQIGLEVRLEPYDYRGVTVANVVAETALGRKSAKRLLIGAHYDSVAGTVGADDNASAVAVQLEVARNLMRLKDQQDLNLSVVFVSFALEEPPVYGTPLMGSRIYAEQARRRQEEIDGILCLEMVGYACFEPGCQAYPFPLMFFGYPKAGNFIGVIGNFDSLNLTRRIFRSFQKNPNLPVVKLTVPFNGWILPAVRLSDHASFWDQGFQAVMITDSAFYRNPHYHLESDTQETLDYRFMAELVKSLIMFLSNYR